MLSLVYNTMKQQKNQVKKNRKEDIMEEKDIKVKACYTPEEVRTLIFENLVSINTIRVAIHNGEIPHIRLGEGSRTKILIPGIYVRKMQEQGFRQNG